jgi:hypothetical protein
MESRVQGFYGPAAYDCDGGVNPLSAHNIIQLRDGGLLYLTGSRLNGRGYRVTVSREPSCRQSPSSDL